MSAEDLGRVFFTPNQRGQLENRQNKMAENANHAVAITLNGVVQKRRGARIAWINGVAQNVGSSTEQNPEILLIPIPGKTQPMAIRVGQKVMLDQPYQPRSLAPDE
ncbi:MAG: hypothetical protein V4443_12470 [Pseudomonadota bacterium]